MVRGMRPADNACLTIARMWEYPLWCSVIRSEAADAVAADVDCGCAASTTKTCMHSTAIRDSQLTDLYVEDGAVRGIYVRDSNASESAEPQSSGHAKV